MAVATNERSKKLIPWITAGAAAVGAFVGLYGILNKPGTAVPSYQKQVVATCSQVHGILSRDRTGEVATLSADGGRPNDPLDLFKIRKSALLDVMRSNVNTTRQRFAALEAQKTPKSLVERKEAARRAWDAWLTGAEQDIRNVEAKLKDGDTFTRLMAVSSGTQGPRGELGVTLNSSLTALAGQECTAAP